MTLAPVNSLLCFSSFFSLLTTARSVRLRAASFLYSYLPISAMGSPVLGFILVFLNRDLKSEEENNVQNPSSINPEELASQNFLSILFKSRILVILFVIAMIQALQAGFAGSFFPVYFISELGAPASLLGLVFGITTLSGTIVAHYAGKIGEKRGYKPILFISYVGYLLV